MDLMQNTHGYTVGITGNIDLSTATTMRVRIQPPGTAAPIDKAVQVSWITDRPTAAMNVPIDPGDLAVPGSYQIELYDETSGREIASSVGKFKVKKTLG